MFGSDDGRLVRLLPARNPRAKSPWAIGVETMYLFTTVTASPAGACARGGQHRHVPKCGLPCLPLPGGAQACFATRGVVGFPMSGLGATRGSICDSGLCRPSHTEGRIGVLFGFRPLAPHSHTQKRNFPPLSTHSRHQAAFGGVARAPPPGGPLSGVYTEFSKSASRRVAQPAGYNVTGVSLSLF